MNWKALSRIALIGIPLFALLCTTLFASRTNTFCLGPEVPVPTDRPTVHVTNPVLFHEFQMLQASGLYIFSDDPETATHLTLKPVRRESLCGLPFVTTLFTFGLAPLVMPLRGELDVVLTDGEETELVTYLYECETRHSFWEVFRETDRIEELGKALRAAAE